VLIEKVIQAAFREQSERGKNRPRDVRPEDLRKADAASLGDCARQGNRFLAPGVKFRQRKRRVFAPWIMAQAQPARLGVRRGRSKFQQRVVNVENEGANHHVRVDQSHAETLSPTGSGSEPFLIRRCRHRSVKAETESPADPSPQPSPLPKGRGRNIGRLLNRQGPPVPRAAAENSPSPHPMGRGLG
jgi:hypothetical protein